MLELIKAVLNAPALSIALLCVVLALVVVAAALGILLKREKGRNGNGQASPRQEAHFAKVHGLATDMTGVVWRVGRLEADVDDIQRKVEGLLPRFAAIEEAVGGLKEKVGDVHDGQERLAEKLDRIFDRLSK